MDETRAWVPPRALRTACEYAEAILVAVLFAVFARAFVVEAFEIPSGSMERTLLVGDHVVVDKLAFAPHAGPWRVLLPYRELAPSAIAIFRSPEDPSLDLVKRVAAVSGDTFRFEGPTRKSFRNGLEVAEPWARYDVRPAGDRESLGPLTVPPGSFLALGDNRDHSRDSRTYGPVPTTALRGRPLFVYWSRRPADEAPAKEGPPGGVRDRLVDFWDRTRWSRTFRVVR